VRSVQVHDRTEFANTVSTALKLSLAHAAYLNKVNSSVPISNVALSFTVSISDIASFLGTAGACVDLGPDNTIATHHRTLDLFFTEDLGFCWLSFLQSNKGEFPYR
jgi:hypothetical protein